MTSSNITFFGLSVTETHPGFVEQLKDRTFDIKISKVTFGGMQPNQVKFLFKDQLKKVDSKYIALEWSTSAFRSWFTHKEYCISFVFMIAAIIDSKKIPIVIDLPRHDVDYPNDWVVNFHKRILRDAGIPYLDLTKKWKNSFDDYSDFLIDGIHTNQAGATYYADEIEAFIRNIVSNPVIPSFDISIWAFPTEISNLFCCEKVTNLISADGTSRIEEFSRGGYTIELLTIPEQHSVRLDTGCEDKLIIGLSYLSGPDTGKFELLTKENKSFELKTYDRFCYYKRLSGRILHKHSSSIEVKQLPDIPDTVLLKGEKYDGPRVGYIGDIFIVSSKYYAVCDAIFEKIERYLD